MHGLSFTIAARAACLGLAWAAILPVATLNAAGEQLGPADRRAIAERAGRNDEAFWNKVAQGEPFPAMTGRKVFSYALELCVARQHRERLARLLELGARLQDRDPQSRGYGNLKWSWEDAGVTDFNAGEFCTQHAAIIWLYHREWLSEPARRTLRQWLVYSVEGCLRHHVPASYTNIALLNAGNLIVLGESLDRPDAADEGYRRLDAVCLWTWAFGISEYTSPTYYGTDLDGLELIEAAARRQRGQQQARALLELVWTDIAVSWFPAAERLAGPQSRTYDYLRGLGELDRHLWIAGWIKGNVPGGVVQAQATECRWSPPARLRALSVNTSPKLVRQNWGARPTETAACAVYADVTLACAGAAYGTQDMPLLVDLPGKRTGTRCYFIADGREDPYGKNKYETGAAGHLKALHLKPFWAGAQRNRDAVGLAIYRAKDLAGQRIANLQSHLVLRRSADGFWLGGRRIELPRGTAASPSRVTVGLNQPLVLRYGTAAVGIRLLWACAQDGRRAEAALVDDGNAWDAVRLTVEHRGETVSAEAGAALWIRIGSGLATDAAFEAWRKRFEQSMPRCAEVSERFARFDVPGEGGTVSVAADAPFGASGGVTLEPGPPDGILQLDGREIGRPILESVEPVLALRGRKNPLEPLDVPAQGSVWWEAETGLILPGMTVTEDAGASGGAYVGQPMNGRAGRAAGSVVWSLRVAKAGRYYLWGRVWAPDEKTNSFGLRVLGSADDSPARLTWQIAPGQGWQWRRLSDSVAKSRTPTALSLPAGLCRLELLVREPGTRIDRVWLTSVANEEPR
ncbi:MAG: carbohydrate-binding protein [Pirellulales bacterium]